MRHRTGLTAASGALAVAIAAAACGGTSVAQEVARDKQVDTDMAAVTASGVPGVAIVIRDGASTSRVASGVYRLHAAVGDTDGVVDGGGLVVWLEEQPTPSTVQVVRAPTKAISRLGRDIVTICTTRRSISFRVR